MARPSPEKDYRGLMWHLTSLLFLVIVVSLAHLIETSQFVHAIQLKNTAQRVAIAEKVVVLVFLKEGCHTQCLLTNNELNTDCSKLPDLITA